MPPDEIAQLPFPSLMNISDYHIFANDPNMAESIEKRVSKLFEPGDVFIKDVKLLKFHIEKTLEYGGYDNHAYLLFSQIAKLFKNYFGSLAWDHPHVLGPFTRLVKIFYLF